MLKSQARKMLSDLIVTRSAEQEQAFTREEAEWLIDSSMNGQLDDEAKADIIGAAAVPVWNRMIQLIV